MRKDFYCSLWLSRFDFDRLKLQFAYTFHSHDKGFSVSAVCCWYMLLIYTGGDMRILWSHPTACVVGIMWVNGLEGRSSQFNSGVLCCRCLAVSIWIGPVYLTSANKYRWNRIRLVTSITGIPRTLAVAWILALCFTFVHGASRLRAILLKWIWFVGTGWAGIGDGAVHWLLARTRWWIS